MNRLGFVCAAVAATSAFTLFGEDFALTFRKIPAQEVTSFPAASGGYGMAMSSRPAGLQKESKRVSRHPLYGQLRTSGGSAPLLLRLDESNGDGTGYDQLIVDINQNGDLTDDPVASRVALPKERNPGVREQVLFGPIELPADRSVAGGRPVIFVETYFYNRARISGPSMMTYNVPLRVKAGWYLETTVELDGVKQKLGVYDANANFHLGDIAKPATYRGSGLDSMWNYMPGDVWLVDVNGSGKFESDASQSESVPFGPILYFGGKPWKVSLSANCSSLRAEPWPDELAEVALQPEANAVRSLTLAWERSNGNWQLICPTVADGRIKVPPGSYRLYGCELLGGAGTPEQVMVSATERVPRMPMRFAVGKANTLQCGAPLQIKVSASKAYGDSGLSALFSRSTDETSGSVSTVRISASVVGAEGEIYSSYFKGEKFQEQPAKPTFKVVDTRGKEVASGNLEFG